MKSKGLVLSCFLFFTTAIYAGEPAESQRGAQGLLPFSLTVGNGGTSPLDCQATTAHWYSLDLGRVAAGKKISAPLWKNLASGEVIILNEHQDRMPVQRIWCGAEGQSWQTRSEVILPTGRGERPQSIALTCASLAGSVACRPD
ncbi:hypothetical protein EZJ58_5413 [Sodalis ligni]|uniref:Uncharacterized protein n=1 Tax=Sodalis ligni TaxID=2697027 RepID=A0A4R1NJ00_9GAMM|nr:hypothetical protein EZJ58_5413 [Sodalis ligni]